MEEQKDGRGRRRVKEGGRDGWEGGGREGEKRERKREERGKERRDRRGRGEGEGRRGGIGIQTAANCVELLGEICMRAWPGGHDQEDMVRKAWSGGLVREGVVRRTLAVLNPLREPDTSSLQDTDMAGPLVFCLAFGGCLLLVGKLQFGYIYGIGVVGCLAMYTLLNLMSMTGVAVSCIVSVLGYCLLPMVLLSSLAVLISLKGVLGVVMTTVAVLWCSVSASKLFVTALAMDQQQLLVAYPCALVYGVFALLTVF
ncbi:Protein YIPF5 [Lamellibrachia satsuma]|nr:Protein YIPF5 [Lamellibrachia satsuma]